MSLWIILFVISTHSVMTDKLRAWGHTPGWGLDPFPFFPELDSTEARQI